MTTEQPPPVQQRGLVLGLIIGLVIAVGVAIALAASQDGGTTAPSPSAARAGCRQPTTQPAAGQDDHRNPGQNIEYASYPPAAGPHYPSYLAGTGLRAFYSPADRPPYQNLVHNLEHGFTIAWFDAESPESPTLERDMSAIGEAVTGRGLAFIAAPWSANDGPALPDGVDVALTHWSLGTEASGPVGVTQLCAEASLEAVEAFMIAYPQSDSPEGAAFGAETEERLG